MTSASAANSRSEQQPQILIEAVEAGDARRVRSLLAAGADPNTTSLGGKTVLMLATMRGYLDIIEVLLAAGADVNARKENGSTALILAVLFGYVDLVRVLLEWGADPDVQTPRGTTAERWAQSVGFTDIVELLRNADALRARGGERAQSMSANDEARRPPEIFPADGQFRPVVPLAQLDETPPPETTAQAAGLSNEATAFEREDAEDGSAAAEDSDEATIITPRHVPDVEATPPPPVSPPALHVAPPPVQPPRASRQQPALRTTATAHRGNARRSWPVALVALFLILIVGVILQTFWKNSGRVASTRQSAPVAAEASVPTDNSPRAVEAQPMIAAPVQPASQTVPQLSMPSSAAATVPASASRAAATASIDERNLRPEEEERIEPAPSRSTPVVTRDERRAREAATGERAVVATEADAAERPKQHTAPPDTRRQEAQASGRAPADDAQVVSPSSPVLTLPVTSPARPTRTTKKDVIQWP